MSVDGSIGYWSRDTINSPFHCGNYDVISDDEILEVSLDDVRRGHRSLDTIHSSSRNHGGYHSTDDGICELIVT